MRAFLAAALLLLAAFPAAAQTFAGAMSGSWWDPSRGGEGQYISFETVAGRNVAYLAYFTYTAEGRATWHVGSADFAAGATSISVPLITGSGARFGADFRAADVRVASAGTAELEFVSCTQLRMRHSAMAGEVLNLARLVGPLAGAGCGDTPPVARALTGVVSGSWWSAARGGEGQFIKFETVGVRNVVSVAYFTYTADGNATWLVGNADLAIGARSVTVPLITGSGARFGSAFRAADVIVANAGAVTLTFASCASLGLAYSGSQSFALDLTRLVGPLAGLPCNDAPAQPEPLGDEERSTPIASAHAGFNYDLGIYFPPGYSATSGNHPVIYTADREFLFRPIVDNVRRHGLNAIVVAVGNGGADRRWVDYTFPTAANYYRFLTRELMPAIETRYRVDRTRRTYVGYSLSGSFAGIAMLLDDPAGRKFGSFISVDGSFWYQTAEINQLEQALANGTRNLPVALFFAGASNASSIQTFSNRLADRSYQGLRMRYQGYAESHAGVVSPGLTDGLIYVFGAP
jgi:predicted alpha/beta superfamily hydrolase